MVNVTIYNIHGSYGYLCPSFGRACRVSTLPQTVVDIFKEPRLAASLIHCTAVGSMAESLSNFHPQKMEANPISSLR